MKIDTCHIQMLSMRSCELKLHPRIKQAIECDKKFSERENERRNDKNTRRVLRYYLERNNNERAA